MKLHDAPDKNGVAIGVTIRDLQAGSVIRLHADNGLILSEGLFSAYREGDSLVLRVVGKGTAWCCE